MTAVYSVPSKEVFLNIDAQEDDTLVLHIEFDDPEGVGRSESVRVDPEDLARELITASPAFALAIGELVQKAVFKYLRDDVAVAEGNLEALGIATEADALAWAEEFVAP